MPTSSASIHSGSHVLGGTGVRRRLDSGGGALRASSRASSPSLRHFGCSPTLASLPSAFQGRRLARSPSLRTFPLPSPYGLSHVTRFLVLHRRIGLPYRLPFCLVKASFWRSRRPCCFYRGWGFLLRLGLGERLVAAGLIAGHCGVIFC